MRNVSTTAAPQTVRLRRVMSTPGLVLFGLAAILPLTVFTTYGVVAQTTESHVPAAYFVTSVAMLFTAISYATLVRAFPHAGSAYFYARRAFGAHVGFLTGWTLMLDYLLLPLINYLAIGIYFNAEFTSVPAWIFSLGGVVLVTGLVIVGITIVKNINLVLVCVQLAFAAVFVFLAFVRAAQHPESSLLQPFYNFGLQPSQLFAGAAILALSFLGFDTISTLSEEARNPRLAVPRAIVITTLLCGFLFIMISCAAQLTIPDEADITDPDAAAFQIMGLTAGRWLEVFFLVAYLAGCFGAAIAAQVGVTRILYAMGRDGVLPRRVFGVLSARFNTPVGATLFVALISLSALVADLATVATLISFGALAAFSLVNLSAAKHFVIDTRQAWGFKGSLVYLISPLLGFTLTIWLWLNLSAPALITGLCWFATGLIYLAGLTRLFRRQPPEVQFDPPPDTPLARSEPTTV
jgi:putrescine importer